MQDMPVAEIIEKIEIIHEEKAIKIFEIYCFISSERDAEKFSELETKLGISEGRNL